MRKRDHIQVWANHAALNAGSAIQCVYHIVVPPQIDHMPHVIREIHESKTNPAKEFLYGMGALKRPKQ